MFLMQEKTARSLPVGVWEGLDSKIEKLRHTEEQKRKRITNGGTHQMFPHSCNDRAGVGHTEPPGTRFCQRV